MPTYPKPKIDEPSEDEIEDMCYDGIAVATDGCSVEPDGICSHGYPSWLLELGII